MSVSRIALKTSVFCLFLAVGCRNAPSGERGEEKPAEQTTPVAVTTTKVVRSAIADAIDAAGVLEPPPGADVKLGSLATGTLVEVRVSEGDRVHAGQLLARVEPTPLRDALRQAEAALHQSRVQAEAAEVRRTRTEKMVAAGIASQQEAEEARSQSAAAEAAVRTAEAAVSTARIQLSRTEIVAPFDGLVAHVFVAAGEPLDGSGKPVVEIAQTRVLELRAGLTASQAMRVRPGQRAEVRADGVDTSFAGQVIAVAPVVDPVTGVAIARIRVGNPEFILKGGAFARARLVVDVHQGALVVPRSALVPADERGGEAGLSARHGPAVEVVRNHRAQRQIVTLGYSDGRMVEVREGLAEGDEVVIQGAYALPDGTPVESIAAADGGSIGHPQ